MHHIIHPSKEQVRAYMAQREQERRPPPSPDEIRRQLGWRLCAVRDEPLFVKLYLVIPASFSELAALIAVNWMFATTRSALHRRTAF